MTARITFFPVGNGDMTLLETDKGKKILIDCRIRKGDDCPDVITQLRDKLTRDSNDRLFIDLFVWSHPDEDHCQGAEEHFHLGKPEDWNKDKDRIFINGIWSSPIVYRRADRAKHKLSDDAKALNKEIKRRVQFYKDNNYQNTGNHVLILGEDEDGKTDDIKNIVLQLDTETNKVNEYSDNSLSARLLAPSPRSELDEDEEKLGKNHSSAIINFRISCENNSAQFLSAGDAEVLCWEKLLERLKKLSRETDLEYDILQAPHHCSWHSLSDDSLSEKGDDAKVSESALEALGKAKANAFIISSSHEIADDENDPPAYRAKEEYVAILDNVSGSFKCVADHKKNGDNVPLVIEISSDKIKLLPVSGLARSSSATASAVNRKGGDGYA